MPSKFLLTHGVGLSPAGVDYIVVDGLETLAAGQYVDDTVVGYTNRPMLGLQWYICARCDFAYPADQVVMQPGDGGGIVVCIPNCLDMPSRGDVLAQTELPTEEPLEFIPEDMNG